MNYSILKTHKIIGQLQQRQFTSVQDKKELEEITHELAQELAEWILSKFGQEPTKYHNKTHDSSMTTIILLLKQ